MKLYMRLAQNFQAFITCRETGNTGWAEKHYQTIKELVEKHMPSGSGFDNGTSLGFDRSMPEGRDQKLIFLTSFHHMNDVGMYDGWTEHVIKVYPDLRFGFRIQVSGHDRNEIKDLISQAFDVALNTDVE